MFIFQNVHILYIIQQMQRKHSYPIESLPLQHHQPPNLPSTQLGFTNTPQYRQANQNVKRSFITPYCQYSKISPISQPKFPTHQPTTSNNSQSMGMAKSMIFPSQTSPHTFQQPIKKLQFFGQQSPFQQNTYNRKIMNGPFYNNQNDKVRKSSFYQTNHHASTHKIQMSKGPEKRGVSPIPAQIIFKEKLDNQPKLIPKSNLSEFLHRDNKNKLLQSMIISQNKPQISKSSNTSQNKSVKHEVASTLSSQNNKDSVNEISKSVNKIKRPNIWPMTVQPLEKKSHDQEQLMFRKQKQSQKEECMKSIADFQTKNRLSAPLPARQKKQCSLQDFQIVQKIGKGAYGDVFLAQQKKTSILCVIKTISKNKIKQQKLEQHIFRQIKLQMYMNHRHLTTLYGFFHDQNKIYLILEYLPDGNLSHVYRKKKVPEQKTSILMKQVCDGLSYMHRENIIHRDIKPQNLFIHQDYIKIGDFGCAVFSNIMRTTVVGCLAYISPEQLTNSDYDEKIDVWSLGILTYELLTGKPPFQEDIIKIARHEKEPKLSQLIFPQNIQFSDQARDFVQKLLRENPDERMDIRNALKHPFITKYRDSQQNKLN